MVLDEFVEFAVDWCKAKMPRSLQITNKMLQHSRTVRTALLNHYQAFGRFGNRWRGLYEYISVFSSDEV